MERSVIKVNTTVEPKNRKIPPPLARKTFTFAGAFLKHAMTGR
jgi:hypothetical protein